MGARGNLTQGPRRTAAVADIPKPLIERDLNVEATAKQGRKFAERKTLLANARDLYLWHEELSTSRGLAN
jgi:hypothetical protein